MAITRFSRWLDTRLDSSDVNDTVIAVRAHISASYLSQLRNGLKSSPSNKVLKHLAAALSVSVREVFEAAERPLTEDDLSESDRAFSSLPSQFIRLGYECSAQTQNLVLTGKIVGDGILPSVRLSFSARGISPLTGNGTLNWSVNGQQVGEMPAPVSETTLRLQHGENEFSVCYEQEKLTFKFFVPI